MTLGKPECRSAGRGQWDVWVDGKIVGHLTQVGGRRRRRYDWEAMDGTVGTALSTGKATAHVLAALIKFRELNPE